MDSTTFLNLFFSTFLFTVINIHTNALAKTKVTSALTAVFFFIGNIGLLFLLLLYGLQNIL